jgi:putative transcriptional regulator
MKLRHYLVGLAAGLLVAAGVRAADFHDAPVVLVAKPQMGGFYQQTVLFAWPAGGGRHVGFILNRPTTVTVRQVYPGRSASDDLSESVFLGGPDLVGSVFALVHQTVNPGNGTVQLADETFLAKDKTTVDSVIERNPADARFFTGMVVWQPGELEIELRRGFWYVRDYDVQLVFRGSTDGMWEDLAKIYRQMV